MISPENIQDIEAVLAGYIPRVKEITGKDLTLDRMRPLMAALGNPQDQLQIIHVAGTSGKTSTSYFIASLLAHMGKKVGLTVSPHVDSVFERVQINLELLDEAAFGRELGECIDIVKAAKIEPTYFELLIAFANWYFAKVKVDFAVIETGLGGLHDGTNIAEGPDKLCVITDIGLDHMHILGSTVPEIARQKAGIIHQGNTVVMHRQSEEIMQVFKEHCETVGAKLVFARRSDDQSKVFVNLPDFQKRNWQLAVEACMHLGLPALSEEVIQKSMGVQVPGRMEVARIKEKTIIMDGAHNEQKTEAFVRSFISRYPNEKVPVLLSLKQGKEFTAVLPLLKPITSRLIITAFKSGQDLPSEAIDPQELAMAAERFGFTDVTVQPDLAEAYNILCSGPKEKAIITGSFYLLGQLRALYPELTHGSN